MSVYQVGVVGYGLSARVFHIPYVLDCARLSLRAIVQRRGDEAQRDHPTAIIYRDAATLFADPAIDLVLISTPPTGHVALATQALAAGKHVVVEKPFAATSAECDGLIAAARKADRILSVYQNRRWDADFVTLRSLLQSPDKPFGRIVEFENHIDRYNPPGRSPHAGWAVAMPQPASGALYDLGAHQIDQTLVLFGLPQRITGVIAHQTINPAELSPLGARPPHDAFTLLLHYDDTGVLATLKASFSSAETEQLRFWVRGDRGAFRKYHFDPQEDQALELGLGPKDASFGHEDPSFAGRLTVYDEASGGLRVSTVPTATPPLYTRYYDLLAAALDGSGPVPVAPEDSRNGIRIIELALQSAAEGRTVEWSA